MIFESINQPDEAIIDYTKALELYEGGYKVFYSGDAPSQITVALYRLLVKRNRTDRVRQMEKKYPNIANLQKDSCNRCGELIAIHELGTVSYKSAAEFYLVVGGQFIRFSYPVIYSSNKYFSNTGIQIENREMANAVPMQDFDSIARLTLEDSKGRYMVKAAARLAIKGGLTHMAQKQFGDLGGLAANALSAITETADTRSWTLLPSAIYVSRVRLNEGKYNVTVKSNGRISDIKSVQIEANSVKFLRVF